MDVNNIIGLIQGAKHKDDRGVLTYFNNFDLGTIKRFYILEHPDPDIIRAWQGHKKEQKWLYVLSGSFKIILIKPDNWQTPSENLQGQKYILTSEKNQILHVPSGYINGFKANESNSKLLVFSDANLKDSVNDDFRFSSELWHDWSV